MSNWWWGYCCVLVASGGVVFELQCKVQGCKCHPAQAFDLHGTDSDYRRRRAYEREAVAAGVCPLCGCWAPDLAAGMATSALQKALDVYSGHSLHGFASCKAGDRSSLFYVWERGVAYTRYVYRAQIQHLAAAPMGLVQLGAL